jgi:hypothetical protein
MNRTRRVLGAAAALAVLATPGACGGGSSTPSTGPATSTTEAASGSGDARDVAALVAASGQDSAVCAWYRTTTQVAVVAGLAGSFSEGGDGTGEVPRIEPAAALSTVAAPSLAVLARAAADQPADGQPETWTDVLAADADHQQQIVDRLRAAGLTDEQYELLLQAGGALSSLQGDLSDSPLTDPSFEAVLAEVAPTVSDEDRQRAWEEALGLEPGAEPPDAGWIDEACPASGFGEQPAAQEVCSAVTDEQAQSLLGGPVERTDDAYGCEWERTSVDRPIGDIDTTDAFAITWNALSNYGPALDDIRTQPSYRAVDGLGDEAFTVQQYVRPSGGGTRGTTLYVLSGDSVLTFSANGSQVDSEQLQAVAQGALG